MNEELPAGSTLSHYRIVSKLGAGGMGEVYRAHDTRLLRDVALKILAVEFIDGRILRQFLREVQLTAKLTGHPNVVTVLDSGLTVRVTGFESLGA